MNKNRARDYKKDFFQRVWASGVRDEVFIEKFYEGDDVELSLKIEEAEGRYENELGELVKRAVSHYDLYDLASLGRIQDGDTKESNIPPKKKRRKKRQTGTPNDIASAWERQEALAKYLAGVASGAERINRFRKKVLSGRVLSKEQAMTFLSSPLAAAGNKPSSMKLSRIKPLNMILDTNYKVEERQDDWGPYRKLVWGRRRSSTIRPLLVTRRPIYPGDRVAPEDLRILRGGRAVFFPHPCEPNRFVVAAHTSFIGQLVEIAEKSMGGYPISLERGVWFVLTGEFVHEDPVRIRGTTVRRPWVMSRTTITLEVESWLPPEEVLEQYRHAQDEILGRTPRSLKRNTLAVFEFVNQHRETTWRERLDAWNEQHKRKEDQFQDPRHLYQAYTRAAEYVTGVKPAKGKKLKIAGTDSHGLPIFADKWYLLHSNASYTGTFESREEALADPRSVNSKVLTSKELVSRLAERKYS